MTREHPLLESARRAIQARREKKASDMAWLAYACGITAADMENARPHEWKQLCEAARAYRHEEYGVPSKESQTLILRKLRELEQKRMQVA